MSHTAHAGKTAYITGGASGIGAALAKLLVGKGVKVFIADRDPVGASALVDILNSEQSNSASFAEVDTSSWDSQLESFEAAVKELGRIDYVCPVAGIAEKRLLPKDAGTDGFVKPNLEVIDINLVGVLYTVSLGIQQFRRQSPGDDGIKGRFLMVASVCGFYAVPSLPIYTAAKHALVGLTRSYGAFLPSEGITMSAVCPNVVKTKISSDVFYELVEKKGLMTSMETVLDGFERMISSNESGLILECGPGGVTERTVVDYVDDETKTLCDMLNERARPIVER